MPLQYTENSTKRIGRGTNVNAAAIPANRVVGFGVPTASIGDPIDTLSNRPKYKGVTSHAIAPNATGDVHTEGVVPIESDGTGAIAAGDYLTASAVADATEGRVKTAAPGAGVNADIIGRAVTAATAVAGNIVMCELAVQKIQG